MVLYQGTTEKAVAASGKRLLQDLFDAGLTLGQSVRTLRDACRWALKDATIFTSLVESRFVAGSQPLFEKYQRRFRKMAMCHWRGMVGPIEKARGEERCSSARRFTCSSPT